MPLQTTRVTISSTVRMSHWHITSLPKQHPCCTNPLNLEEDNYLENGSRSCAQYYVVLAKQSKVIAGDGA